MLNDAVHIETGKKVLRRIDVIIDIGPSFIIIINPYVSIIQTLLTGM